MDKQGKILIEFNVKNGRFAVNPLLVGGSTLGGRIISGSDNLIVDDNGWRIMPLTWLNSFSKEKDLSTTDIYGDGEKVLTLVNDKGFTGVLGMTAQDIEYNKALGFMVDIENGLAEVKQRRIVQHAIYFETEFANDYGVVVTKKVWVFGVETQAPSESYEQTTDNINNSMVDYNITIKGTNLKASDGETDYTDDFGNTVKVWTLSKLPGDTGYETFGDSVPTPTALEISPTPVLDPYQP